MFKNSFIATTVFLGSLSLPFSTHASLNEEIEIGEDNQIPQFSQTISDQDAYDQILNVAQNRKEMGMAVSPGDNKRGF
jgi:hypothetical protein